MVEMISAFSLVFRAYLGTGEKSASGYDPDKHGPCRIGPTLTQSGNRLGDHPRPGSLAGPASKTPLAFWCRLLAEGADGTPSRRHSGR